MKNYNNISNEIKNIIIDSFLLGTGSYLIYKALRLVLLYTGLEIDYLLMGLSITFFSISITYNRLWSKNYFSSPRKGIYFGIIFIFLFLFFSYCYRISIKTNDLLTYLELDHKRGWRGNAHTSDSLLGFVPIKNARAFHTFYVGEDIPMAYNKYGFRIPLHDTLLTVNYDSVGILFLGCSFTYGDAVLAEQTFAHLTAKKTGLSYINAGVCAYGLSQMVILADRLIPKYKPRYLVVQHSPWLIKRALEGYAPVFFGSLPTPYFTIDGDSLVIRPPFYQTRIYSSLFEKISNRQTVSWKYFKVFYYFIKEDYYKLITLLNLLEKKIDKPTNKNLRAEFLAYEKILKTARENGTKVIVLGIYTNGDHGENISKLLIDSNVVYVNTDSKLEEYMKTKKINDFNKAFHIWKPKGKDSVWVDGHPNPIAHQLVSKVIIKQILDNESEKTHNIKNKKFATNK